MGNLRSASAALATPNEKTHTPISAGRSLENLGINSYLVVRRLAAADAIAE
jgi:hypothetical protein